MMQFERQTVFLGDQNYASVDVDKNGVKFQVKQEAVTISKHLTPHLAIKIGFTLILAGMHVKRFDIIEKVLKDEGVL